MKLVSISASGFQIHLADLDLLKDRSKTQVFEFEVPIVAHLMWINANPNETFAIGWEFDSRLRPEANGSDVPEGAEEERRSIQRVALSYPILAELENGECLEFDLMDISASGMLMETDTAFDPKEECVLSFDTDLGEENYIPQVGRLVWQKKNRFSRNKYSCGIRFLDADEQVLGLHPSFSIC